MNVHGCNYLAFYKLKENFPFSPSDLTVTWGVVLKPHFASLKRVRST